MATAHYHSRLEVDGFARSLGIAQLLDDGQPFPVEAGREQHTFRTEHAKVGRSVADALSALDTVLHVDAHYLRGAALQLLTFGRVARHGTDALCRRRRRRRSSWITFGNGHYTER
uniref:Uncharacterized protein n=1 Tax=Anopheles coluzzii TaxID=1518534 RepID=A0A8W7Q286_ANOCL